MVSAIHEVNQWGRKDPFTPTTPNWSEVQIYKADGTAIIKGTNGIATTDKLSVFKYEARTTTTQTTINHLIQNPSTHYNLGDGTNWTPIASTEGYNNTDKEGDWWNPTIKTIYDPCPNGYRIPENGTYGTGGSVATHPDWSAWSAGGLRSGRIFKTSSFFPASGFRYGPNGQFRSVGLNDYCWMSTPSSINNGICLDFYHDRVNPSYYAHRSYSLSTRCIKE